MGSYGGSYAGGEVDAIFMLGFASADEVYRFLMMAALNDDIAEVCGSARVLNRNGVMFRVLATTMVEVVDITEDLREFGNDVIAPCRVAFNMLVDQHGVDLYRKATPAAKFIEEYNDGR